MIRIALSMLIVYVAFSIGRAYEGVKQARVREVIFKRADKILQRQLEDLSRRKDDEGKK